MKNVEKKYNNNNERLCLLNGQNTHSHTHTLIEIINSVHSSVDWYRNHEAESCELMNLNVQSRHNFFFFFSLRNFAVIRTLSSKDAFHHPTNIQKTFFRINIFHLYHMPSVEGSMFLFSIPLQIEPSSIYFLRSIDCEPTFSQVGINVDTGMSAFLGLSSNTTSSKRYNELIRKPRWA